MLDFAAFESSIIRIQFLLTSNIKERERYAAEKLKIQATAQSVRDNTADLRVQLEKAQEMLALRKEYDVLADKITSNRMLRPREDQHVNLEKLDAEIAELERESQEYAQTWAERRDQFGKIIGEGMQLRRLIRDEKEEVERREGMEDRDEGEDGDAGSQRARSTGMATPLPDAGGATPMHPSQEQVTGNTGASLQVRPSSRGKSPLRLSKLSEEEEEEEMDAREDLKEEPTADELADADMAEDGEVSGDSEDPLSPPPERLETEMDEEGKADDSQRAVPDVVATEADNPERDKMDVS